MIAQITAIIHDSETSVCPFPFRLWFDNAKTPSAQDASVDSLQRAQPPSLVHASSSSTSNTSNHYIIPPPERSESFQSDTSAGHQHLSRPNLGDNHRVSFGVGPGGNGNGHGNGDLAGGDVVPVGFDEGILRGLCEMDVS